MSQKIILLVLIVIYKVHVGTRLKTKITALISKNFLHIEKLTKQLVILFLFRYLVKELYKKTQLSCVLSY